LGSISHPDYIRAHIGYLSVLCTLRLTPLYSPLEPFYTLISINMRRSSIWCVTFQNQFPNLSWRLFVGFIERTGFLMMKDFNPLTPEKGPRETWDLCRIPTTFEHTLDIFLVYEPSVSIWYPSIIPLEPFYTLIYINIRQSSIWCVTFQFQFPNLSSRLHHFPPAECWVHWADRLLDEEGFQSTNSRKRTQRNLCSMSHPNRLFLFLWGKSLKDISNKKLNSNVIRVRFTSVTCLTHGYTDHLPGDVRWALGLGDVGIAIQDLAS